MQYWLAAKGEFHILLNPKHVIDKAIARGFSPLERQEFHARHCEKNLSEYAQECRGELLDRYSDRKVIYLDMKYWIYLREASFQGDTDRHKVAFHQVFDGLFRDNKVVAPISIAHLVELEKIRDTKRKQNTIKVMERYSDGLSMLFHFDRLTEEFVSFFNNYNSEKHAIAWKVSHLDRIARIYGTPKPSVPSLGAEDNIRLQKYFYDLMSYMSFSDFMETERESGGNLRRAHEELAKRHNRNKVTNTYESFQDALLNELNGFMAHCDGFIQYATITVPVPPRSFRHRSCRS